MPIQAFHGHCLRPLCSQYNGLGTRSLLAIIMIWDRGSPVSIIMVGDGGPKKPLNGLVSRIQYSHHSGLESGPPSGFYNGLRSGILYSHYGSIPLAIIVVCDRAHYIAIIMFLGAVPYIVIMMVYD